MHIGARCMKAMHKIRLRVSSDMRPHPKVPVVALLGLMYLGVTRTGPILLQARCLNDRGIHNCALGEPKPFAQEELDHSKGHMFENHGGFSEAP